MARFSRLALVALISLAFSLPVLASSVPGRSTPTDRTQAGGVVIVEFFICVLQNTPTDGWGAPRECAQTLRTEQSPAAAPGRELGGSSR